MSRKNIPTIWIILRVGGRIKKIRGALTQTAFAKILGIKANALCRYEKGRIPDGNILKKIADYGKVSVEWLLSGDREASSGEIVVCKAGPQLSEHAPEIYQVQRPEPLEAHLLYQVLAAMDDFLKVSREKITLPQRARLITKVYNECAANFLLPDHDLVKNNWPLAKFQPD